MTARLAILGHSKQREQRTASQRRVSRSPGVLSSVRSVALTSRLQAFRSMAQRRFTRALNSGFADRHAAAATNRFCASSAASSDGCNGVTVASASQCPSVRSTSAMKSAPSRFERRAKWAPTNASTIIINGEVTALGGGRSNSCTEDTVTPPSGTYWPLEGGCNHDTCGVRKTIYGMQPASCAPVASCVRGAA